MDGRYAVKAGRREQYMSKDGRYAVKALRRKQYFSLVIQISKPVT